MLDTTPAPSYAHLVKAEIEERFAQNLDRVMHLIAVYAGTASGQGRRRVEDTDVLRAAVVFLHATLEDFLWSLLEWKLPGAPAKPLEEVPLLGKAARTKFTLDELAMHRGKTMDEVITQSVSASLKESNFNILGKSRTCSRRSGWASNCSRRSNVISDPSWHDDT